MKIFYGTVLCERKGETFIHLACGNAEIHAEFTVKLYQEALQRYPVADGFTNHRTKSFQIPEATITAALGGNNDPTPSS